MKINTLLFAATCGMLVALPLSAHHNCNTDLGTCPEDIGDYMNTHEDAISDMLDRVGEIDPDGSSYRGALNVDTDPAMAMDPADGPGTGDGPGGSVDDGAGSLAQPRL